MHGYESLPETLILRGSRAQAALLLVTATAVAVFMRGAAVEGELFGAALDDKEWVAAWLIYICCLVSWAPLLMSIAVPARLTLDKDGFETRKFGICERISWRDAGQFSTVRYQSRLYVLYELDRPTPLLQWLIFHLPPEGAKQRALFEGKGRLPERFGMRGEKLAELMNVFRLRALSRQELRAARSESGMFLSIEAQT